MLDVVNFNKIEENTIPFAIFNNQYEDHVSRTKIESVMKRILENIVNSEFAKRSDAIEAILERTFELRNKNCSSYNPFNRKGTNEKDKGSLNEGITFPYSLKNNSPTNALTRT